MIHPIGQKIKHDNKDFVMKLTSMSTTKGSKDSFDSSNDSIILTRAKHGSLTEHGLDAALINVAAVISCTNFRMARADPVRPFLKASLASTKHKIEATLMTNVAIDTRIIFDNEWDSRTSSSSSSPMMRECINGNVLGVRSAKRTPRSAEAS